MANHCEGCGWRKEKKECVKESLNKEGECPCSLCILKPTCLYNPCKEYDIWIGVDEEE